jgi:predicted hotdog family 3-hydroxylacyl-ACP dehydratase
VFEVRERGNGWVRCRAHVPLDSPWVADGRAPAFVAIEIGAQAAALLAVEPGSAPKMGFLVGVRDARFRAPDLPAGVDLEVEARDAVTAAPLLSCATAVFSPEGRELASATVSVYAARAADGRG